MEAIRQHPRLDLQVAVTGMHLLKSVGNSWRQIVSDGWRIDARIPVQNDQDDATGQSRCLGRAIVKMTDAFAKLKAELVLVLGDRLEAFAAAATATASQIPIGHIHGGDVAVGVQDEAYRHAITKLAHVHFVATSGARRRLIRLGEEIHRVHQTGSPGLDGLDQAICNDTRQLTKWACQNVEEPFFLVLQHPSGASAGVEEQYMTQTLAACAARKLPLVIIMPNIDPGFSGIVRACKAFARRPGVGLVGNLPRGGFLGLLSRCTALIGNSSSGLIEAEYFGTPVVNIGPRQMGRERGKYVIDVNYGKNSVIQGLRAAQNGRRNRRGRTKFTYGDGRSGARIADIIAKTEFGNSLLQKKIAY